MLPRFTLFERIQHIILFSAVILAVITGLPMKFPEARLSQAVVVLVGGVEMRSLLHRIAGWTMIILGVSHVLYYMLIDRKVRFYKRSILFTRKDASDFYQHMRYLVGLRKDLPQMGRYTWFEKFDYLGATWGLTVMAITGLAMLYMETALEFIPLSWLQALWAAHSEEAMLATLFLLIVHMYHVHFSADRFPMSLTWLHGKISRREMKKYHPIELRQIESGEGNVAE
jgi:cytochrome b subunit of formate dehydrogenase